MILRWPTSTSSHYSLSVFACLAYYAQNDLQQRKNTDIFQESAVGFGWDSSSIKPRKSNIWTWTIQEKPRHTGFQTNEYPYSRLGGAFYPTTSLALSSDENKCARVCHGSVKWPCLRMRRHPFGCAAACEMNLESEWDPATEKRRPTDWQWHCMPHSA